MSTWALVLGVIPIPLGNLVAIGLATAVLLRCRDGRDHGKGQAITALVIAPLWLFVFGALFTLEFADQTDRDPAGVTARGDVAVESLEVRDCLPTVSAENTVTRTLRVVPCSEPHLGEVFAKFELAEGTFPGKAEAIRLAQGGCAKRVAGYVEEGRDLSTTQMTFFYPVEATWSRHRSITCIAVTPSPSTGSLKGTGS